MDIRCVLFDIGGVLLTLGEEAFRQEVASRFGLEAIPAAYETHVPALQRGETTEVDVWSQLVGRPVDCSFFADVFIEHFPIKQDMIAFARELKQSGLTTAILSNTERTHVDGMRRMGFLDEFAPVFLSCEIGKRKPEKRVYTHVVKELNLSPEHVVYIDDVPEYVDVAKEIGIHGVLCDDDGERVRQHVLAMIGA